MNSPELPSVSPVPPRGILIVEDHPIVRDGLAQMVHSAPGMSVVAAVSTEVETKAALRAHQVDLVLLDLMLESGESLRLIADLIEQYPRLKILILSAMKESVYAERALRAGALGYIMKSAETSEVLQAIESVLAGHVYLSPRISVNLFRGLLQRSAFAAAPGAEGLSDRQLQIFQLVGSGTPNREIARQLGISVKTVETHRENLKLRLGLRDSTELAGAAERFVQSMVAVR